MLDGSKWGRKKDDGYVSVSDEEILPLEGLSDEESEGDDEEVSDGQDDDRSLVDEEEELDNEAWGSSRKAYYGADDVSEDEDIAQEEQEAERLQKKHLARLRPDDFLDTWAEIPETTTQSTGRIVTEELPPPDLSKLSKTEVLKILKTRHPEIPWLAGLYQQLYPQLSSLSLASQRPFHPQHTILKLKFAVLSVLLSSIAVYFAVRADIRERNSTEKKLLAKITETEGLWEQISSITIDENAVDVKDLGATETKLDNLITTLPPPAPKEPTRKRKRQVKSIMDESDASDDDLATTLALLKKSRTKSTKPLQSDEDLSDFGDATTLHPLDAQEKHQNKKTLRFYTSQIENKLSKRHEKYSGDTEVFKERRNDRNERQIEAARKRGLTTTTDDAELDDNEPVNEIPASSADNEYYDLIASRAAKKRDGAKEEYESAKASARAYLLGETDKVDDSGKRLITRQIEKNKGLMPHRSKDVRNPRVKKRKKYEKKKIALKGRQQVYQAGDKRRGAYGGEQSGISKNVVKSVKLG